MQIIVLGMHRSGTSMVTRLVNMMGAYFGAEGMSIGYNRENPKGFWERRDVLNLNDSLLQHHGCNWHRLSGWPLQGISHTAVADLPPPLRHGMKSTILEMDAFRPFVVKDPRLCLTLPYWQRFLEVPVAVVVHRSPLEVARSLQERNSFPLMYGLVLWEYYAVCMLNASHGMPRLFIRHRDAIEDPVATTARLYNGLREHEVQGLRHPSAREITAFVEARLYRAREDGIANPIALTAHQRTLEAMLKGDARQHGLLTVSDEARALMESYSAQE